MAKLGMLCMYKFADSRQELKADGGVLILLLILVFHNTNLSSCTISLPSTIYVAAATIDNSDQYKYSSLAMSDLKVVYNINGGDESTNRVCDRLDKELQSLKKFTTGSPKILTLEIIRCTEGSRWGRICCAELGEGWIILKIRWALTIEGSPETVLATGESKLEDSGNIGCSDLCDSNYGEHALLDILTPKLVEKITLSVRPSLSLSGGKSTKEAADVGKGIAQ